jgi:hypothetical protein
MKFCTTCGAQMQDGQLFCSKCGAKSLDTGAASQPQHSSGYEDYKTVPIYDDNPQTPPSSGYVNPPVYQPPTPVPPQGKKKLSKGAIIGIVIGAVVLVLVIVGIILGVALSSSDSAQDFDDSYSQGDYSGNDSSDDSQSDDTDNEKVFDFSAGEISGNTYTNSSLGITFTASPDGLDSDKPTLDLDNSRTSKSIYDSSNGEVDETENMTYDKNRGMFCYDRDSMQYWIDAELNLQLPYDDYDGESDTYIYVVKCNEKFDNTTDYNKAFMLEYLGDGDEIKSSDPETGTANIGRNKYYYSIYESDKNPTFMIASTYKCGYYISIVINTETCEYGSDIAKDTLACFS